MKYVRTKDGRIIKIPNKHKEIVYDGNVIISVEKIINGVRGETIVSGIVDREADTIEELCDAFVAMCDEYKAPFIWNNNNDNDFKKVKQFYEYWGNKNRKHLRFLYGAIWTDQGLSYVAQMNEEGELELL